MDKRKKIFTAVGVVAGLLLCYLVFEHFMYVSTDDAYVEAHATLLAPKVAGYIVKVNVNEGQRVKKDDVLVEIDGRDYENALVQAKGELASLEARRRDADRSFQRIADLYKNGAVSQQQFDTANATHTDTRARYDAVAAQVAQAQLNLDNTKLRAPSDGFIAKKSVELGQLAAAGVPLIGFVDGGERWVTANYKETDLDHIKVGAKAYVDVDAIGAKKFKGEVEAVSAATGATFTLLPPDNATGNFTKVVQRVPVKIKLNDLSDADRELLRAGLSANVDVDRK
jgi:membrane fusion protein (multidrug efflux system)